MTRTIIGGIGPARDGEHFANAFVTVHAEGLGKTPESALEQLNKDLVAKMPNRVQLKDLPRQIGFKGEPKMPAHEDVHADLVKWAWDNRTGKDPEAVAAVASQISASLRAAQEALPYLIAGANYERLTNHAQGLDDDLAALHSALIDIAEGERDDLEDGKQG